MCVRLLLISVAKNIQKIFKGKIYLINSSHFSGGIFFKINSFFNLLKGFIQSFKVLLKLSPDSCISFGSYATSMPLMSIILIKTFKNIDIYIHEQNSIIGKVNLFFIPYTKFLFTNFQTIRNFNPKYSSKYCYVGMPLNHYFAKKK